MVSFGANVVKKADISDRITDKPSLVSKISARKKHSKLYWPIAKNCNFAVVPKW